MPNNFEDYIGFNQNQGNEQTQTNELFLPDPVMPTINQKHNNLTKSKQNKINRLAPENANVLTAEELQVKVGEGLTDDQVYDRSDGSMYQMKQDWLGNYKEVEFTGKTQDVYIDNTANNNMKLGLASHGFDERYNPNSKYGFATGEKGVTTEDGALMNVKLPRQKAQELEYLVHSNKGQIENRVGGNTYSDFKRQKLSGNLGTGATEYTTQNAPLWNIDYKQKEESLGSDVLMPVIPKHITEKQRKEEIIESFRENQGIGDRILNTAKGAASMFTGATYDVADLASELVFNYDLGTDEEKTEEIDKLIGYNRKYTSEAAEVAKQKIKIMNDTEWTAKGVFDVIVEAAQTPEFLGESVGYMLSLMVGGPAGWATKANKAAKAVKLAQKAGDTVKAARLAKDAIKYRRMAKNNGAIKNALDKLVENAGLVAVSSGMTNDDLDKYAKEAGIEKGEIGAGKMLGAFAGNILLNSLDRTIDKALFFNPTIKNGLIHAVGGASKTELKRAGKGLAEVTGAIALGSGVEAATEYAQTFIEQVNQQFGEQTGKTLSDVWYSEDNELERQTAGALGASGATQMQAVGSVGAGLTGAGAIKDKVVDKLSKAKAEKVKKTVDDEDVETVAEQETRVKTAINTVIEKAKAGEHVTSQDLNEVYQMEEIVAEMDQKESSTIEMKEKIDAIKDSFVTRLEESDDDGTKIVLGSSQEAIDMIESVFEAKKGKVSEKLNTKLANIAKANGVDEKKFKEIKDRAAVEIEATTSKIGYKTYGKALRGLLANPDPDPKQVKTLIKKMNNFRDSQEKWKEEIGSIVDDIEVIIATYEKSNKKSDEPKRVKAPTIKQKDGSPYVVNVEYNEETGKYSVGKATYNTLDDKQANIDGIIHELSISGQDVKSAGIDTEESGIQTEVHIPVGEAYGKHAKSRKYDEESYKKYGITKVITSSNISKWSDDKYGKYNSKIMNTGDYTVDDVVLISVPNNIKDKDKFIELLKSKKGNIAKNLRKQIDAAAAVGATIVLEDNMHDNARGPLVAQLTTFKNYNSLTEKGSKNIFMPKDKAKKTNAEYKDKQTVKANGEKLTNEAIKQYNQSGSIDFDLETELIRDYYGNDKNNLIARLERGFREAIIQYKEDIKELDRIKKTDKYKKGLAVNKVDELNSAIENAGFTVISEAKRQIDETTKSQEATGEFLTEMRDAKEKGISDDMLWKSVEEQAIANEILDNSSTADGKMFYQYVNSKGTISTTDNVAIAEKNHKGDTTIKKNNTKTTDIIKVGRPTIVNTIRTKDMGQQVVDYVAKSVESIKAVIPINLVNKEKKGKWTTAEYAMINSPARGILLGSDGITEVFNDNVVLAMKLAIDEYVAYSGNMMREGFKSDDDIARMLGINKFSITNEMRDALRDKGMLKKTLANSLGSAIISKLGFARNKNLESEQFDKLKADIGQMAILMAEKDGQLKIDDSMTATEYAKDILGKKGRELSDSVQDEDATVAFVKLTIDDEETTVLVDEFKEIHELIADEDTFRKAPSTRPIKKSKHEGKVAKDEAGIVQSEEVKEVMRNLIDEKWTPNMLIIERMLANEESLKEWLGYNEDTESGSFEANDKQVVTNREVEKSLDELKELVKMAKDNPGKTIKLYFDWFYSSNGRYFMDSNTLNPQTDKLHRFLISPEVHMLQYENKNGVLTVDGQDITEEVNYALTQAFGFAVDKKATRMITKIANGLKKIDPKVIEKHLIDKTEIEVAGIKIKPEEIGHAYQGLDMLEKINLGGSFESALTAETDAVTSGFAIKLMQMPILNNIFKWLNKVGLIRAKDAKKLFKNGTSMNDVLSDTNFHDSYQTLATQIVDIDSDYVATELSKLNKKEKNKSLRSGFNEELWTELSRILPQFDKELKSKEVSSELRALFKDPFMTFNYSAGIKSIRESLASNITNGLVNELVTSEKGSNNYKLLKVLADTFTDGNIKLLIEQIKTKPTYLIKPEGSNISLETMLMTHINASYGAKVQEVMEGEFEEFMKAHEDINDAFAAMFATFYSAYKAKLKKLRMDGVEATDEVKLEVIDELRQYFPAIKSPMSDDTKSGIGVYKNKSTTPSKEDAVVNPAQTVIKGDKDSIKIRHKIKEFEAAISAGSVVPIHFIDAAMMGRLVNSTAGGEGSGITSIHDAIMPPLNKLNETTKEYNKQYIEVNREYSFIAEINDQLQSIIESGILADSMYDETIEVGYGKDAEKIPLRTFVEDRAIRFARRAEQVKIAREALFAEIDEGVYSMHMAGMEGGVYEHNVPTQAGSEKTNINTKTEVEVEPKIETDIMSAKKETIDDLAKLYKNAPQAIKNAMLRIGRDVAETATSKSKFATVFAEITKNC